ncbi:MAG: 30S ribosomal protein S9 [Campylobacterales bacterium]|nr:30S ribosomal protein S9 [Campylobacterales bacterium]
MAKFYGTGRRKTAVAKVWVMPGSGKFTVNNQSADEWCGGHLTIKQEMISPLAITKQLNSIDVIAVVKGGGYSAQADAIKLGLSRALICFDAGFRALLKPKGMLTRDSRIVERKKYGKRKARRSPQFSKR